MIAMQSNTKKPFVTFYQLEGAAINLFITDGVTEVDYSVNRGAFEDWFTGGTGQTETEHNGAIPMENFWKDAGEINDHDALQALTNYINRTPGETAEGCKALAFEKAVSDICGAFGGSPDGIQYATVRSSILHYSSAAIERVAAVIAT